MARLEAAVAALAGRQAGVVSRAQLLDVGMTAKQIESWLRRGRLIRIHRNVYAVGHGALTRPGRLRAASLIAPDVGLAVLAAGEWLEIVGPRTGAIHVTCPRLIRVPPLVAHHRNLPEDELEEVDGVLTTTLARTALDIGAFEGPEAMIRAMRGAERRGVTDPIGLPALLDRYPQGRGTAVARRVLEEGLFRAMTESWLEDVFLPFLSDWDIKTPIANPTLNIAGHTYRPDCLWPGEGLIVELDGKRDHMGELAFESDRERDAELVAAGYRVIRITRRQVELDPAGVARRLRAALAHGIPARAA